MIDDRHLPAQQRDEVGEPSDAVGAETCRRLVEEQQPGLAGERNADFERAPVAIRKAFRA